MELDELKFVYSPQEPAAAAPVAAPAQESAPVATESASTSTATATTSAPTVDASAGGATGGSATATAPSTPSWLDGLRSDGFRTTETDEGKIRKQLVQSYQDAERLRPLAPALSAYQQNAAEFQQWLADKQRAAQQQAAKNDWTSEFYQHPNYDPAWQHQVKRDENGNLVPVAGAPLDIVPKYQAAQAFRQDQVEKFLTNPFKYMEPAIRKIAGDIADQRAQQGVGQYREQQEANQFVNEHSNWLFEQDGGKIRTNQVINPQTGRYSETKVLSPYGQMFLQNLQEAASNGLSPKMQEQYAMRAVQNAYMASPAYIEEQIRVRQGAPAAPAQTPREAANAAFTQKANPAQRPAPTGGNAVPSTPKVTRENIEQVMLKAFRDSGVTGL